MGGTNQCRMSTTPYKKESSSLPSPHSSPGEMLKNKCRGTPKGSWGNMGSRCRKAKLVQIIQAPPYARGSAFHMQRDFAMPPNAYIHMKICRYSFTNMQELKIRSEIQSRSSKLGKCSHMTAFQPLSFEPSLSAFDFGLQSLFSSLAYFPCLFVFPAPTNCTAFYPSPLQQPLPRYSSPSSTLVPFILLYRDTNRQTEQSYKHFMVDAFQKITKDLSWKKNVSSFFRTEESSHEAKVTLTAIRWIYVTSFISPVSLCFIVFTAAIGFLIEFYGLSFIVWCNFTSFK